VASTCFLFLLRLKISLATLIFQRVYVLRDVPLRGEPGEVSVTLCLGEPGTLMGPTFFDRRPRARGEEDISLI